MIRKIIESMQITGMARIGYFPVTTKEFEVYVNTDDTEQIPHLHIRYSKNWHRFNCYIRFEAPLYLNHSDRQDKLDLMQKKELIEYLKSKSENSRFKGEITNWDVAIDQWNRNNGNARLSWKLVMPDYTKLL